MTNPSVEKRKQKRLIFMSADTSSLARVKQTVPADWTISVVTDSMDVGEWSDILLYRFILLDLNEQELFDPLDVIRELRTQYQVMIPVFCFGGDENLRNEMRMARADRFFGEDELIEILPKFIEQYNWG